MQPYTGMPVTYIPRPGRRETEMAALVTAVHADDRCDLIIFPPMGESYQQPKVPMLSDAFKTHVWVMPPANDAVALLARIEALEAKRGPGRPPNTAKSEAA